MNVMANLVGFNLGKAVNCLVLMVHIVIALTVYSSTIHEQPWVDLEYVSHGTTELSHIIER